MTWDEALVRLHQAPHAEFVAERKRLAAQLPKDEKAKLLKVGRPPISAWAVNQLWFHARAQFDALLATAAQIRGGDLSALGAHKAALTALRSRAAELLTAAGNAAADATLQRVHTTLTAIAAEGGFGADVPGTLSEDRDPPGFAAIGVVAPPKAAEPPPPAALAPKKEEARNEDVEREAKEAARTAAAAAAAAEKAAREKAAALEKAQAVVEKHEAKVEKLEAELAEARAELADAQKAVDAMR